VSSVGHEPLGGYRVIIAEDEVFLLTDIIQMLEAAGAEIAGHATSVQCAMRLALSTAFDCAVLDVKFLDGDIDPVADALHQQGIALVFVTANDTARLSKNWPAAKIVTKPFWEYDLISAVASCRCNDFR
jgi:CheY-like chemotaxis protein